MTSEELDRLIEEELEAVLDEKSSKSARRKRKKKRAKKKAKRDACYHKVKSRYKVWPSAYASGALVKCRKVGAKNWGNKSKKNEGLNEEEGPIEQIVRAIQGTTPGRETPFDQIISQTGMSKEEITQIGDTAKTDDGVKIFAVSSTGMQMSKEYRQGLMAQAALGGMFEDMDMPERTITLRLAQMEDLDEKKKKKKPCKKAKGKRYVKRVNGRCRSFGQAGKAKGGGDRIRPGTKKGDAYCARSAKIKKCKNPPCANDLSRKKWKCRGSKSMRENEQE